MKKLLPNLMTSTRICLGTYLLFYILGSQKNTVFIAFVFVLAFLSDYFDGKTARLLKVESDFGKVFDVMADIYFVFAMYFVFAICGIIRMYVAVLVVVYFAFFLFSSLFVCRKKAVRPTFIYDSTGRVAAALIYVFPLFIYILQSSMRLDYYLYVATFIEVCILIIVLLSTLIRFHCLKRMLLEN